MSLVWNSTVYETSLHEKHSQLWRTRNFHSPRNIVGKQFNQVRLLFSCRFAGYGNDPKEPQHSGRHYSNRLNRNSSAPCTSTPYLRILGAPIKLAMRLEEVEMENAVENSRLVHQFQKQDASVNDSKQKKQLWICNSHSKLDNNTRNYMSRISGDDFFEEQSSTADYMNFKICTYMHVCI